MNCIECKKRIKEFLDDSLNAKKSIEFIDHVRHCDECMEELSIEFLVTEGLKRLDTATSFDLESELDDKLNKAYAKAGFYKNFLFISGVIIAILAFLLGVFLSTMFGY